MKNNTIIQTSKSMVLGVLFLLVMGLMGACGGGSGSGPTATIHTLPSGNNTGGLLGPIVSQPGELRMALCAEAGNTEGKCRFPGMQFAASHQKVDSLFAKYQTTQ